MVSWLQFGLAVIIFLGGCLGVAWRFGYVVASLISNIKAEFNAELELLESEQDKKIARVYDRFDDFKKSMECTHVRRELCAEIRGNFSNEFKEIKSDLKDIKAYLMENKK
jgi:hypothetical protein